MRRSLLLAAVLFGSLGSLPARADETAGVAVGHGLRYRGGQRRIFVGGYSAGAVTSLYAAEVGGGRASRVAGVVSIAGGGAEEAIDRHDPPALMFHGTRDDQVPFRWARETCSAYRHAGASC